MVEEIGTEQPGSPAGAAEERARGHRQVKVGTVVSAKMKKTVVVAVEKPVMHRLYQRSLKRSSRFMAHDEENACREGDLVELQSTRPLSRGKRWKVSKILKRAEG
jgi:small subunit ribosomal protein S17